MKTCNKCLILKSLIDFHSSKRAKDGKRGECKRCSNLYNLAFNKKNPHKKQGQNKRHFEKYESAIKDKQKDYRKNNASVRAASTAKRRTAILRRTPPWLTDTQYQQIKIFYDSSAALTKE